jgi:hypothetical protein
LFNYRDFTGLSNRKRRKGRVKFPLGAQPAPNEELKKDAREPLPRLYRRGKLSAGTQSMKAG